MQPLELVELPQNTDMISVYIDGRRLTLMHKPFITAHIMYVPVLELSGYWNYAVERTDEGFLLCDNDNDHEFTESYIYDVNRKERRRLDYLVKKVGRDIYVDARYFLNEHGITITWEKGSYSTYFASVLHYDGYRHIPEELFYAKKAVEEYMNMFMYVDGAYYQRKDGNCKIVTPEGIIYLGGRDTSSLTNGREYRFCFRYEGTFNNGSVSYGNIWEIVEVDNTRRIGNMLYAEDSWNRIQANSTYKAEKKKDDGTIDKEALVTMFRQNPYILRDRKMLNGHLNDLFPKNRRDINLIMYAFDNDVFTEIDDADELDDQFVHRMTKKLIDNNGTQMQYALDAVCLCCEVYGVRIRGKQFIAKSKYSEATQTLLKEREYRWIAPEFKGRVRIEDMSYPQPQKWETKPFKGKDEGYYYYPYNDREALIHIRATKLSGNETVDSFPYGPFVSGMAKSGDVVSVTDVMIGSIKWKKINHHINIDDKVFETDSFIYPYGGFLYGVTFGENVGLTNKMQQFEERFLRHFMFFEKSTGTTKEPEKKSIEEKKSSDGGERLKNRAEMMDMIRQRYAMIYDACDSPTSVEITGFDNLQKVLKRDLTEYVLFLSASSGSYSMEDKRFLREFLDVSMPISDAREYIDEHIDLDAYEKTAPRALMLIVAMENLMRSAKKLDLNSEFFVSDWTPSTELVLLYVQIGFAMSIERKDGKSPDMKRYANYLETLNNYLKENTEL